MITEENQTSIVLLEKSYKETFSKPTGTINSKSRVQDRETITLVADNIT